MANYTGPQDINKKNYDQMEDSFHEDAKEYIDNMLIRPADYDPADMPDPVPYIIAQISINYAMEQYALSRMRAPGDYWDLQHQAIQSSRISFERRFNPTVHFSNIEEKDKGRMGGVSARTYRV